MSDTPWWMWAAAAGICGLLWWLNHIPPDEWFKLPRRTQKEDDDEKS